MESQATKYKDLDTNLKRKLSGSMNFYLRSADFTKTDDALIKEFLYYSLNEDDGTYSYLDKKTYEPLSLNKELVKDLIEVFKERLKKARTKANERGEEKRKSKGTKRLKKEYSSLENVVIQFPSKNKN